MSTSKRPLRLKIFVGNIGRWPYAVSVPICAASAIVAYAAHYALDSNFGAVYNRALRQPKQTFITLDEINKFNTFTNKKSLYIKKVRESDNKNRNSLNGYSEMVYYLVLRERNGGNMQKREIAIHEAGHAITTEALGGTVNNIGIAETESLLGWSERTYCGAKVNHAKISMAGKLAEYLSDGIEDPEMQYLEYLGDPDSFWVEGDEYNVLELCKTEKQIKNAIQQTIKILRMHWDLVIELAEYLLSTGVVDRMDKRTMEIFAKIRKGTENEKL